MEAVGKDDLYGQMITVISGKQYGNITFETDLPLKMPEITELDGHFTFELKSDRTSLNEGKNGTIQILSDEGDVIAEMKLEIIPQTIFSISSLILVGAFVIALTSIGSFFLFKYSKKRANIKVCGCDPSDANCECEI
jgi:hypothetical protein